MSDEVDAAWAAGARNVLMRLDTGGGKTRVISHKVRHNHGASAVIAHRHELVSQLSMALARDGVPHNIIAQPEVRRGIIAAHMDDFGRSFFNPSSLAAVASVDTLNRAAGLDAWAAQVTLWVTDEGHHVVLDNKWHRAIERFTHPLVRGLLPTATPSRADGKGLGRDFDGVADVMVEGPPMRWLIEQGYLTDYRVVCRETDMPLLEEQIGSSGDWSNKQLRDAARNSDIVGDVVKTYLEYAAGRLWITFCPDTETAAEIERAYNAAGIRAALVTGNTDTGLRRNILKRFERREITQLVAVDIISEGFDVPAVEGASMARKTASLGLYMQQFGRVLRTMPGKEKALIIDHVGNFLRHGGAPDKPRPWTLARRDKRKSTKATDDIPLRVCTRYELPKGSGQWREGCFEPFERIHTECPYCGLPVPPPDRSARSSPAMVDGDLAELDAATLSKLREAVEVADMENERFRELCAAKFMPTMGQMAAVKRHDAARGPREALRAAISMWGGWQKAAGLKDSQMQRKFFFLFGVDVLTAWALGGDDADALRLKIEGEKA